MTTCNIFLCMQRFVVNNFVSKQYSIADSEAGKYTLFAYIPRYVQLMVSVELHVKDSRATCESQWLRVLQAFQMYDVAERIISCKQY